MEGDIPEDQHECGDDREVVGDQLGEAKSGSRRKNPGPLDQQLPQVVGVAHLENQVQDFFFFLSQNSPGPTSRRQSDGDL